ncbi:hypothetical protein DEO72_LG7g1752 [Vigna unguiculata]|uniref:Uncharacterized protein n=1 Tax=Vigna unguiculata TaxID=3917 RepID=A0A4D6MIQ1_VIGUN|nr:hypothetical protein DEO72_LG7g1752 [Vigna unguiculata]
MSQIGYKKSFYPCLEPQPSLLLLGFQRSLDSRLAWPLFCSLCESGPRAAMLLDSVSKSRTNPFPGREAKTLLLCPVFLWFDCHFEFARLENSGETCKSRPSESVSPRRDEQGLAQIPNARKPSPRRRGARLSEHVSPERDPSA